MPKSGCPNVCDVNYKMLALLRETKLQSIDALVGLTDGNKSLGTGTEMHTITSDGRPRGGVLSSQVDNQLQAVRTKEIAGFAIVGLLLAVMGLYAVLSYVVQQRTQEIGIRGVLGAGRGRILGMVLSQAMGLTTIGIAAGLVTALRATRLMQRLLYGTPTNDVGVYLAVSAIALVVGLVASYVPARRAARVDPIVALRSGA